MTTFLLIFLHVFGIIVPFVFLVRSFCYVEHNDVYMQVSNKVYLCVLLWIPLCISLIMFTVHSAVTKILP